MDVLQLWQQLAEPLSERFSPINYGLWIAPLTPRRLEEGVLTLASPTTLNRNYFVEKYKDSAEALLGEILKRSVAIEVIVEERSALLPSSSLPSHSPVEAPWESLDRSALLTLDAFVAGPENQFLLGAAKRVVEKPGEYNPLFVYGPSGIGKTHLLKGILNEYLLRGRKVKYLGGHQFYNLYFSTTQNRTYDSFYGLFKGLDLLLIDDLQFFKGKLKTQETFSHIFNSLYDSGAQLVLAADRRPSAIAGLEAALLSRLNWGLCEAIEPHGQIARRGIVACLTEGLTPSPALLDDLSQLPFSSIRDLEGFIMRLRARCDIQGITLTREIVESEFSRNASPRAAIVGLEEVKEAVCKHFDLSKKELVSQKRAKRISRPRQVAMYLAKKHTTKTLPQIGDSFGRKAHSTVHSACAKIDEMRERDQKLLRDIEEIERLLRV